MCLYLLPMSAILKYHKIGYHVYADDTQLSFKCKQPLEAHIFILETLEKLGIYYRIMLVLLLFMHLLVVD